LRSVKYYLLFIILISALLGSLTWIIFDPITILERTISHSVWPALNWLVTRLEFMLYRFVPSTGAGLSAFDSSIRPALLPDVPVPRQAPFLFAMLFAALVSLNWLAPRFWCRYLCPLGGLLGIVSKVSVIRRTVFRGSNGRIKGDHDHRSDGHREHHKDCTACKLCSSSCPTGTIDPDRNFESDPAECTMCLACLDACPRQSTSFKPVLNVAPRLDYDPDRRAALVSIGASVCGAALLSASWLHQRNQPFRLRPPGVVGDPENHGGDMPGCIRCGACLQACPTSGLQPALSEAGLEGLWTPVLVPRLGYCDYSCNACGQVCPVGAIPSLTLEAKRTQTIGKAYIDQDRCLAWADGVTCIVCEEMCPLPEKAITWDEGTAIHGREPVQRPVVNRDLCIGCGICEYKCPLPGKAAIQVEVV
jgi:ferredoxin